LLRQERKFVKTGKEFLLRQERNFCQGRKGILLRQERNFVKTGKEFFRQSAVCPSQAVMC